MEPADENGVQIRPFDGLPADLLRATDAAFGSEARQNDLGIFVPLFESDRALAAYDGERVVGTALAYSLTLTVPGGALPAAMVGDVGVLPTHRRRGIMRRLMRRQLDDIHQRGESLAGLWASEGPIYGRFGYGHHRHGSLQVVTSSGAGTGGPPFRVGTRSEIVVLQLRAGPAVM